MIIAITAQFGHWEEKIGVFLYLCGIQRFDDNSDLILRPQSRISWIISPQCIIIIGVVVFVTVESQSPPVSSLEDLGIIAGRTR